MPTAVVIANPEKPEALALAGRAERALSARGLETVTSTGMDDNLSGLDPVLAVVFGGDGTVLWAVAGLGPEPPPVLAFNVGRLGYLADNPPDRLEEMIADALEGRMRSSRRMMIDATVEQGGETRRWTALNEFALATRSHERLLPISVAVDDEELMDLRGDGVVVSTPTGSTAYALSAGGPVASPELSALILAPICPHQLANRSLVLDPGETVTLRHLGEHPVELMADGRFCREINRGEKLRFRMSQSVARLLSPARGRYKVLREKLGWGWKAEWERRESARISGRH